MNAIVSKPWVLARMYEPDVTIVDCRFELGKPEAGKEAYEREHIPGAIYLDLEKDLSSPVREHGGRIPYPTRKSSAVLWPKTGSRPKRGSSRTTIKAACTPRGCGGC
ncbi:Rhodanese-like domain protein [Paenibacillus sp. P1XP2]|nr:Rhodanese-like domain protein [Paenibacillus sp. P1XP2]